MKRTYALLSIAITGVAAALVLPRLPTTTAPVDPDTLMSKAPQVSTHTTGGQLNLRARPARHRILASGDELDVVYEISAPASADAQRLPVDFALVFDRSGSMSGDPLMKAKIAALSLLDKLLPTDRLAIIDFGSESHLALLMTPMTEGGKTAARQVISAIAADGGTNTSSALQLAESTLLNAGAREQAVRRIALLSDGKANEGIVGQGLVELASELGRQHMRLSALGLGLDFDETLMTSMADAGGGQYRYLRDADEVSAALSQELAQAASTAASSVSLTLTPGDGVEIREVVGYETARDGRGTRVDLSDIAAGELRHVVVHLHAGAGASGNRSVVSGKLAYDATQSDHAHHTRSTGVTVEATTDSGLVTASVDRDVASTGIRARLGSTIMGALRSYDRSDVAGASASLGAGVAQLKAEAEKMGDSNMVAELDTKGGEAAGMLHAAPAPAAYAAKKSLHSFGLSATR